MADQRFKPGEFVPADGIYNVIHHEHRLLHGATLTKGMRFPSCRRCHLKVRFILVRAIRDGVLPFRSGEILEEYISEEPEIRAAGA